MRAFARTTLADAVARLRPGMKVLLPPGCGEPVALVAEICRQADRLRDLTLLTGFHLGEFPFARPETAALRVATWHMSPRLEEAHRRGRVEFVPARYFDLVRDLGHGGRWAPDCVLIHVVTEYGAAGLRGRSERERAAALVAVAHPGFRAELARLTTS